MKMMKILLSCLQSTKAGVLDAALVKTFALQDLSQLFMLKGMKCIRKSKMSKMVFV